MSSELAETWQRLTKLPLKLPTELRQRPRQNYDRGLDRDRQRPTDRQADRLTESRQTDRGRHSTYIVPVRIDRQRLTEADSCQPTESRQSPDRAPTEPRQSPTEPDRPTARAQMRTKSVFHICAPQARFFHPNLDAVNYGGNVASR